MSDESSNFLREIIKSDLAAGTHGGAVVTRFPPEPNGYLHIGHAKAICVDFGLAREFGGQCNLRMDDTNPEKEETEYVSSIKADVRWLGFEWGDGFYNASDYFDRMYACAEHLVREGKAYVCFLSGDEVREYRGTVDTSGKPSPTRDASAEDNLVELRKMREGAYADGHCTLRAKIDLTSSNMKLRDPPLYRIRRATHHNTGDAWCIYPFYDYAHPLEDAFEGITHSICTLEFQDNRAIYDWVVANCPIPTWAPRQYEMARLSVAYTITSKRKLIQLVTDGHVRGWDDPRMPTLAGFRRRGVPPEAIVDFCERVGVGKADNLVDPKLLDACIRDALNHEAPRVMAVLDPLKVTVTNWPEGTVDMLPASYWPHDVPKEGERDVPFSGTLYVDRDDFAEVPPKKWRRLAPGAEVRLRYGYLITCTEVVKDADGNVTELRCTYDPASRGGTSPDGRKVAGTLHWVSAAHSVPAEVRLYEPLFTVPKPAAEEDYLKVLNPSALTVMSARVEPGLASAAAGDRFQFERTGYFVRDADEGLVFNRVVTLKDRFRPKAPELAERKAVVAGEAKARTLSAAEERRATALAERGVPAEQAAILAQSSRMLSFFEAAVSSHDNARGVAALVTNELMRATKDTPVEDLPITPARLARTVALVDDGTLSSKLGRKLFAALLVEDAEPDDVVAARGWKQIKDPAVLQPIIDELVAANPDKVAAFRAGRDRLKGFFVGQVMKRTGGQADPGLVQRLVGQALEA
ncbi:MAG: glutamine--tRNA ligase/YqeY domain fusion protein [Proteobacteria bacterium]|nr:glutamine--tRNA ligase/YqeY domain fusion protein [Pseudomonadota bacterium]MCP4921554.1 glutamine--tRNA ligase/YqeY domain fusion protein [Pseudomonadota bacterium]